MIEIKQTVRPALSRRMSPEELNAVRPAVTRNSVQSIMRKTAELHPPVTRAAQGIPRPTPVPHVPQQTVPAPHAQPQTRQPAVSAQPPKVQEMRLPALEYQLRQGQKTALELERNGCTAIRVCVGWNVTDPRCDVDVSVFACDASGKVPSEDWFVFYGNTDSPDRSVSFRPDGITDREAIRVDVQRLDPRIRKLVFVMTINEAFERNLNFSMIRDAYIRVLDDRSGREIVSYRLQPGYANVTSMTLGEVYQHNGAWKFNPVGNGVHEDLAGQCAIYGVEIC